jgi:hypothetical protein
MNNQPRKTEFLRIKPNHFIIDKNTVLEISLDTIHLYDARSMYLHAGSFNLIKTRHFIAKHGDNYHFQMPWFTGPEDSSFESFLQKNITFRFPRQNPEDKSFIEFSLLFDKHGKITEIDFRDYANEKVKKDFTEHSEAVSTNGKIRENQMSGSFFLL